MLKKFAVTMATAAMVAASAMTAMAATNYFYVYENGTFGLARMGQDCVESVEVDGDKVTMQLQAGEYTLGTTTYTGKITNAWIDQDGDGVYDEDNDEQIFDTDVITYDQSDLATDVDGTDYANFYIQVSIYNGNASKPVMVKTQNTYVPMQR